MRERGAQKPEVKHASRKMRKDEYLNQSCDISVAN